MKSLKSFISIGIALFAGINGLMAQTPAELLTQIAGEVRAEHNLVGVSLAAILPDGMEVTGVAGLADESTGEPLTATGKMLAGSTGKVLFAAVALQLAVEGLLDLDAKVSFYLGDRSWYPRLPNGNDMTVRHLLNHTAGLAHHYLEDAFLTDYTARMKEDPAFLFDAEQSISYILDKPAPFAAGQGFQYSDTHFTLLGLIVEQITGQNYYNLIQDRLLSHYNLKGITPSNSMNIPGLVTGHWNPADNHFRLPVRSNRDAAGDLRYNPAMEWAGGGFAATPLALARLAKALYEDKVVPPAVYDQMMDTVDWVESPNLTLKYGLGVITRDIEEAGFSIGHSGFYPGYRTEMYYFPEKKVAFALMVNSDTEAPLIVLSARIAQDFIRKVTDHNVEKGM